jgi:heme/copper-type cytochrome/quinol oxidase subunit 3
VSLLILNEGLLFVSLFFAYFYLGAGHPPWPPSPPKILLALVMLALLLASSATLWAAERRLHRGRRGQARALLLLTLALGVVFVVVQVLEYRNHLRELTPRTNAYGSVFYALTTFHGLHVVVGLLMLAFVAALPDLEPRRSPHQPLRNAALYWHFVDGVWVVIVGLLYLLPRWKG